MFFGDEHAHLSLLAVQPSHQRQGLGRQMMAWMMDAISVAGVYRVADGKIIEVPNSGGVSPRDADAAFRQREAEYSKGWYAAIAQDTWGTA